MRPAWLAAAAAAWLWCCGTSVAAAAENTADMAELKRLSDAWDQAIIRKDRAAIGKLFGAVHELLTKQETVAAPELGKLAALSGVREYPSRVKCASLCWHTLNAALAHQKAAVSTE